MLPLINLQLGELRSFDTPQSAPGLIPDGADALDGDFAEILHVRVAVIDEDSGAGGESLQSGGRELPLLPISPLSPLPSFDTLPIVDEVFAPNDKFQRIEPIPQPPVSVAQAQDMLASSMSGDSGEAMPGPMQNDELTPPLPKITAPELVAAGTNPVPTIPASIADEAVVVTQHATENATRHQRTVIPERGNQTVAAVPDPAILEASRQALAPRSSEPATTPVVMQPNATRATEMTMTRLKTPATTTRRSVEPSPLPTTETVGRKPEPPSSPAPAVVTIDEAPKLLRDDVAVVPRQQPIAAQHSAQPASDPLPLMEPGLRNVAEAPSAPPRFATAQLLSAPVDLSVQDSGWDRVISERVLMMANGRLQNAEIRLTPAELGPLRIQVAIEEGTANVAFQAQHAVTREAIELALPRLRELMAENGLTLGQTNVSDDGIHQGGRDDARAGNAGQAAPAEDAESQDVATQKIRARASDGLVDTFA